MSALVIVGLIAIVIFVASYRSHNRKEHPKPFKPVQLSPPSPRVLSEEERLAAQAAEVRERWEAKLEEVEGAHENEMEPIKDRLEKARHLVDTSGVGTAACDILGMSSQWPALSQSGDGGPPFTFGPLEQGRTRGIPHGGHEGEWLGWTMDAVPYPPRANRKSELREC